MELWVAQNNMSLNSQKNNDMVVCFARRPPLLSTTVLGGTRMRRVNQIKPLGVIITDDLKWQKHIDYDCERASLHLYFLKMLRRAGVDPKDIATVYIALVRSNTEYACVLSVAHGFDCTPEGATGAGQWGTLRASHPEPPYGVTLLFFLFFFFFCFLFFFFFFTTACRRVRNFGYLEVPYTLTRSKFSRPANTS